VHVDTNAQAHPVHPSMLPPCVRISSLSESHICHTHLALCDNHILSIPVWGHSTSIEPVSALTICGILLCPDSVQVVYHTIGLWILRILATNGFITIAILKTLSECRLTVMYPNFLFGDCPALTCLTKLNSLGVNGSRSSQQSDSAMQSDNNVQ
jgi:hypothetical protein